jgi:glucan-binding YG repeat protein
VKPQEEAKEQPEDSKAKVVPIDKVGKQSKEKETETERAKKDTPFNKPILKNQVKQAEPTYPYPENNNEDEIIAGWMSEEEIREWIRQNLRPLNDDFLDYF